MSDFIAEIEKRVIGQENLKKVCYNIYHYLELIATGSEKNLPFLIAAPSGCGKSETYRAVKDYFRKNMKFLYIEFVDCSALTEAGFKGNDPSSVVGGLLDKPNSNGIGIVFLDEVDKKVVPSYTTGGTNVNAAVQHGLLTIMEGCPVRAKGTSRAIDTSNTLFVAMGAFDFLRNEKEEEKTISFGEQKEKREIVMMVMYDMYNSLESIKEADAKIRQSMEIQLQMAEDSTLFDKMRFQLLSHIPSIDYTETTERIFSSNIETINTVGNVLFTENVAEFYQKRQLYKTLVSDSIFNEIYRMDSPFLTLKSSLDFEYNGYAYLSIDFLQDLQKLFTQCRQMMKVTDEEIEAYRKEREQMEGDKAARQTTRDSLWQEVGRLQEQIDLNKSKRK